MYCERTQNLLISRRFRKIRPPEARNTGILTIYEGRHNALQKQEFQEKHKNGFLPFSRGDLLRQESGRSVH